MLNIFNSYIKKSSKNIYLDLFIFFKTQIENGTIKEKLPPIRQTAQALNISTNTVVKAYLELEKYKYVESKPGSGFFICYSTIYENNDHLSFENEDTLYQYFSEDIKFDFINSSPNISFLPVKDIQNSINFILNRDKEKALIHSGPLGSSNLRISIFNYLKKYNIKSSVDNIHILSGAQQGIDIISKALIFPGDIVVVEKPTYLGALNTFKKQGAKIKEVPILSDGICLSSLEYILKKDKIKFLYLMSNFQTPTGISISNEKKEKLIELSKKYNFFILEDDSSADLFYTNNYPYPIRSLNDENVIYIKSFSKIFMPGFRLGFCIIPSSILIDFLNLKKLINLDSSTLYQEAFAHLLNENLIEKQMLLSRKKYKTIQYLIIYELKKISDISFFTPKGGLSIWIKLPHNISGKAIYTKLLRKKTLIVPGYIYSSNLDNYIKLNYAQISETNIKEGIKLLKNTILELQFFEL
ncbi:PLP-dependent aminotransferase family protein [uncultured Cetobacterium sp.]|uniref:aminotransferase-like domain-containing protein n=1 Tax=uncultured Cetobacterium sp. TaxID=527638 RepID=UPI0026187168|nr:PLP-dependent aminotransferase family protein [uncultured Cetobacterium sp.]